MAHPGQKTRRTLPTRSPTLPETMNGDGTSGTEPPGRIPTRTRAQAMDWSLVLLSQGIESMVIREQEPPGWALQVSPEDLAAARSSLQRYEEENRAWPFRHPLPWIGFSFDWSVLAWVGLMTVLFALQGSPGIGLEQVGIGNAGLVRAGEWWRPVTATTLHADPAHLMMNAIFGFLLIGLAMGRFGSGLTLLATLACGVAANLVTTAWREDHVSGLGASGVVMAALGLLAADATVQYWKQKKPPRLMMEGILAGLMLFVLVGVSPTSDVAAHAIGCLSGLGAGLVLAYPSPTTIHDLRLNLSAGVTYCLILGGAWGWGLLHGTRAL